MKLSTPHPPHPSRSCRRLFPTSKLLELAVQEAQNYLEKKENHLSEYCIVGVHSSARRHLTVEGDLYGIIVEDSTESNPNKEP